MTTTQVVETSVTVNNNSPIQTTFTWTIILNLLMNIVFVIQTCNEQNKIICCLRTNALVVGTLISMVDVSVSIATTLTGLWSLSKGLFGSFYLSGKLPTYPSPKPTLTLTSHLGQNVGLGEG